MGLERGDEGGNEGDYKGIVGGTLHLEVADAVKEMGADVAGGGVELRLEPVDGGEAVIGAHDEELGLG